MIKKIIHKAKHHKEAETWDMRQQVMMSTEERQESSKGIEKTIVWK